MNTIADQHIRDAVLDITQSFLVQAPAGSGKTSLLVQRFLRLLANAQQHPEEILAITFTRKAATEMRSRILEAIKLGHQVQEPADPYNKQMWRLGREVLQRDQLEKWDLLDNPARLKIQTIDALCSSIAAQMPITAQFGSKPQIEDKPYELYKQAADQFIYDLSEDSPLQAELNKILLHLDNDRVKTQALLISMLEVRDQWLPIVYGALQKNSLREILESALGLVVEQSVEILQDLTPMELDFALLMMEPPSTVTEWQILADKLLVKEGDWRRTLSANQGFPPQSDGRDKQEKAEFKARKEAALEMLQALHPHTAFKQKLHSVTKLPPTVYTDAQWEIINALYQLLPVLVAHLTLVFKEHGLVDFSAVTMAALRALDSDDPKSDLSLALDCKIQHILVDEFQDTSHSQFAMLESLTKHWDVASGKTLFLVGDPMQSIYRFRKAEVGLFLRAKQFGVNNIKLRFVQLQVNFRSAEPLVNWFNKVFAAIFPIQDDMDYGAISYMQSVAAAQQETAINPVQCYIVTDQNEDQHIVKIIKQIKLQQPLHSIAILVRAKSHLAQIIPALRQSEIAFQAVELENLYKNAVVQDLLSLTKAIIHLEDRIAWLSILRAPWCGLSLADLEIIAQQPCTIFTALENAEVQLALGVDAKHRIARFHALMQQALQLKVVKPLDLLVQHLWQNLGGRQLLNTETNLQAAEAYFSFLAANVAKREIYNPGYLEQQLQLLSMPSVATNEDLVQIMTMHKAKGLEFDAVILPGLGKKLRADDQKLFLIDQRSSQFDAVIMAPIKASDAAADPIYAYVEWCNKQRQNYEDLRLLYVAATRAKQQLYCLGAVGKDGPMESSLLAKLWGALDREFVNNEVIPLSNSEVKSDLQARCGDQEQCNLARLPFTWFNQDFPAIAMLKTSEKPSIKQQSDWLRLVGIVVHRILWQISKDGIELWDHNKVTAQTHLWRQQLRQLGIDQQYLADALGLIQQAIYNTTQDSFGAKILSKHIEEYSEWGLTIHEQDDCNKIIIDRAFVDHSGKFWIVDYKVVHDASEISAAMQKYQPQLQKYVKAVRLLRSDTDIKAGLYFPLQSKWYEMP